MAHSGHPATEFQCPLLRVKRTLIGSAPISAFDPKRTFAGHQPNHLWSAVLTSYQALFRALVEATRHSLREVRLRQCARFLNRKTTPDAAQLRQPRKRTATRK